MEILVARGPAHRPAAPSSRSSTTWTSSSATRTGSSRCTRARCWPTPRPRRSAATRRVVDTVVGRLPRPVLMLAVDGIDVYIQASHILRRVSLEVGEREVVCLVGRNGAGKTTTLRTIMGYLRPRAGRVTVPAAARSRAGPPTRSRSSASASRRRTAASSPTSRWRRTSRSRRGRVPAGAPPPSASTSPTDLPRAAPVRGAQGARDERAASARCSRSRARSPSTPRCSLLDEPFEGLSPAIIPAVAAGIAEITRSAASILMAESNIHHVPAFAIAALRDRARRDHLRGTAGRRPRGRGDHARDRGLNHGLARDARSARGGRPARLSNQPVVAPPPQVGQRDPAARRRRPPQACDSVGASAPDAPARALPIVQQLRSTRQRHPSRRFGGREGREGMCWCESGHAAFEANRNR